MKATAVRVADALELIAEAGAAACGMDRRHRIVYWNDAATALLGWTTAEALGKRCYDVFLGRDIFGNICCFRDCGVAVGASRGERLEPFVMEVPHRDGTPRRLVTRTEALPSAGAGYRTLVHLFENGDGPALESLVARLRARAAEERPAPHVQPPRPATLALTPREFEILKLLAAGYATVNIAARLGLSHATVRNHVQKLLRRMEVHSQVEAVSVAFREGLLGRDEDGGDGRIRTDE